MIKRGFDRTVACITTDIDIVRSHVRGGGGIGNIVVLWRVYAPAADIGDAIVNMSFKQIYITQELIHERCGGMIVNLVRRAALFDSAVADHDHAICHFQCFFLGRG